MFMIDYRHRFKDVEKIGCGGSKSFKLGGMIGSCRPNPYGIVGSLESSLRVTISGSRDAIEETEGIPAV